MTDPLLAPLGDYGGPTQTMALLPGSPAIDAGTSTGAPATDQRGIARPQARVDIGAFESRGFTLTSVSGSNQTTTVNQAFANPLVVTVASSYGEPVTGGVVTYTGPGSGASITPNPGTATIGANGQASLTAKANTTAGGPYTVTATVSGLATTLSFTLTNNPGAATHLSLSAPASVTHGMPFSLKVTAQDQFNNTATSFSDTVKLASTDTSATLPDKHTFTTGSGTGFDNGVYTFTGLILRKKGTQTITAFITAPPKDSAITGITAPINVV